MAIIFHNTDFWKSEHIKIQNFRKKNRFFWKILEKGSQKTEKWNSKKHVIHVKSCISTPSIRIATLVDFKESYETVKPTQAQFQEGFQIDAPRRGALGQLEKRSQAKSQLDSEFEASVRKPMSAKTIRFPNDMKRYRPIFWVCLIYIFRSNSTTWWRSGAKLLNHISKYSWYSQLWIFGYDVWRAIMKALRG